jgi:hypothetical protein
MITLTKKQCEDFFKDETINPLTGRTITKGKKTHTNLMKACTKNSVKSPKPLSYEIPPMGPMIYWRSKPDDDDDDEKKYIMIMFDHIQDRIELIEDRDTIESRMEIEEFLDILKHAHSVFKNKPKLLQMVITTQNDVQELKKTKELINDVPKQIDIGYKTVHPKRLDNRIEVFKILSLYTSAIKQIERAIKNKTITVTVTSGSIRELVNNKKKYLDYLIKHKVFTYDDIYKHTFKSENAFDELQIKYKKYRDLYKKLQGNSP